EHQVGDVVDGPGEARGIKSHAVPTYRGTVGVCSVVLVPVFLHAPETFVRWPVPGERDGGGVPGFESLQRGPCPETSWAGSSSAGSPEAGPGEKCCQHLANHEGTSLAESDRPSRQESGTVSRVSRANLFQGNGRRLAEPAVFI